MTNFRTEELTTLSKKKTQIVSPLFQDVSDAYKARRQLRAGEYIHFTAFGQRKTRERGKEDRLDRCRVLEEKHDVDPTLSQSGLLNGTDL